MEDEILKMILRGKKESQKNALTVEVKRSINKVHKFMTTLKTVTKHRKPYKNNARLRAVCLRQLYDEYEKNKSDFWKSSDAREQDPEVNEKEKQAMDYQHKLYADGAERLCNARSFVEVRDILQDTREKAKEHDNVLTTCDWFRKAFEEVGRSRLYDLTK